MPDSGWPQLRWVLWRCLFCEVIPFRPDVLLKTFYVFEMVKRRMKKQDVKRY